MREVELEGRESYCCISVIFFGILYYLSALFIRGGVMQRPSTEVRS